MAQNKTAAAPIRLYARDIRSRVKILGQKPAGFRDVYYWLVSQSWFVVLASIAAFYLLANVVFGGVFFLVGGIENARPGSFADDFFFSVQTMGTMGYGMMWPRSFFANVVVTVESVCGLLITALSTGLVFSKFSRPTARILWSKVAVITVRDGVPTLLFRVANERANHVVEAQLHVSITRFEQTKEGEHIRRVHDLVLTRDRTPAFILTWLAMHPINESSPLHGATAESLLDSGTEILVNLTGLDSVLSQTIHSRHSYAPEDIRFDHRFVDVLFPNKDGERALDLTKFHSTEPVQRKAAS